MYDDYYVVIKIFDLTWLENEEYILYFAGLSQVFIF